MGQSQPIQSQQHLADSLQQILSGNLPDSMRAYHMVYLAMYTEPLDLEKAHRLYAEAVDFSLKKNLYYYAGLAHRFEATPYNLSAEHEKELVSIQKAISLFEKSGHRDAKSQIASCYGNLLAYYRSTDNYDSAIAYGLKNISLLEELGQYRKLVTAEVNLSLIYQQIKLPEKQKEHSQKALIYARKAGLDQSLFEAFLHSALYFNEVRDYQNAKVQLDSAGNYYSETYDLSRKLAYNLIYASVNQNLGLAENAFAFYEKAYRLADAAQSKWNMIEPLNSMAKIHMDRGDYLKAETLLKNALQLAEEEGFKTFQKDGYSYLSDLYKRMGKFEEAFEFLSKYSVLKDSLFNEDRRQFSLDLEKKYETRKKEEQLKLQEIALEKKSLQTLLLTLGIFLLLVILGFSLLVYRQKKNIAARRIRELETEKQLLATESILQGEEQERARVAKDLHDGLVGMLASLKYSLQGLRDSFNTDKEKAALIDKNLELADRSILELRKIAHNLMPEVLVRYGLDEALREYCAYLSKSVDLQIDYLSFDLYKVELSQSAQLTLYRVIQELLGNIIRHAKASRALVQLAYSANKLTIEIEDNGIGLDPEKLKHSGGSGWKNIRARVDYLKGSISLSSGEEGGTFIHIELEI